MSLTSAKLVFQAKKHIEDKTFGLKNKNKSKKVQVWTLTLLYAFASQLLSVSRCFMTMVCVFVSPSSKAWKHRPRTL